MKVENIEKKVENDDNGSLKLTESADTSSKPADEVKCSLCEFVAKNRFGLKIHFHKKHSTAKFKCFTCDFTCESHSDLLDHNEKYYYSHRQVLNKNTSLAAPGALAHRLQRRTACNTSPPTISKMADGVRE